MFSPREITTLCLADAIVAGGAAFSEQTYCEAYLAGVQ
jgi:hypothetical protein